MATKTMMGANGTWMQGHSIKVTSTRIDQMAELKKLSSLLGKLMSHPKPGNKDWSNDLFRCLEDVVWWHEKNWKHL